jgi:hypothetical protein
MSSLAQPLGSFTNWVILRLGELILVTGGLFAISAQRHRFSVVLQVLALGLLFVLPAYFHPFAFGFADDQGITFCRYFKLHFVPWSEVARVARNQRNAFELIVLLERRMALTKTVKFPMNLARSEVDATFHDNWTPDIVGWLIDHLPAAQAARAAGQEPEVRSQKSE